MFRDTTRISSWYCTTRKFDELIRVVSWTNLCSILGSPLNLIYFLNSVGPSCYTVEYIGDFTRVIFFRFFIDVLIFYTLIHSKPCRPWAFLWIFKCDVAEFLLASQIATIEAIRSNCTVALHVMYVQYSTVHYNIKHL